MGVENNDNEKTDKTHEHVNNGEDTIHGGGRVEVGEVIDGGDESVPW